MNGTTAAVLFGSVVVLALAGTAAYVLTRPPQVQQQVVTVPATQTAGGSSTNALKNAANTAAQELAKAGAAALGDVARSIFGNVFGGG